jgi:hypothetical protein
MSEELCELLMNTPGEPNLYMESFQTMLSAPVPDDHKSPYAQEAASVFTEILCRSWWYKINAIASVGFLGLVFGSMCSVQTVRWPRVL